MVRFVVVGVVGGLLVAVLNGVLNANPLARRLFTVYKPVARTSVNAAAGI